jgi:uncharacterized protein (TIGR02265 family)
VDTTGFTAPDFAGPLDVAAHLDACPADVGAKGMFFNDGIEHVVAQGKQPPSTRKYVAFKSYPNRELIQLLADCAQRAYPDVPLREGLRRLGRSAYPTLASSMVGRVVFGVLGKDIVSIFRIAAKGYEIALTAGKARVVEVDAHGARVRFDDIYNFLECYQVGVFEGAILTCDRRGEVKLKLDTPFSGELLATWD